MLENAGNAKKIVMLAGLVAVFAFSVPASAQSGATPTPVPDLVATAQAQSDSSEAAARQAAADLAKAQADYNSAQTAATAARTAATAARLYADQADIARAQEQANAAAAAADQAAGYASSMLTAVQDAQRWSMQQSSDNTTLRTQLAQSQADGRVLAQQVLQLRADLERIQRESKRPVMDTGIVFALAAVLLTGATVFMIVRRGRTVYVPTTIISPGEDRDA